LPVAILGMNISQINLKIEIVRALNKCSHLHLNRKKE